MESGRRTVDERLFLHGGRELLIIALIKNRPVLTLGTCISLPGGSLTEITLTMKLVCQVMPVNAAVIVNVRRPQGSVIWR